MTDRISFIEASRRKREPLLAMARRLIATASPNPPGDTRAVAAVAATLLREAAPQAEIATYATSDVITNVVARVQGAGPGRRMMFNGHLDTYPVNEALPWTVDPLGGLVRDGQLLGRGAADMKGGIAASIAAFALLSEHRHLWHGEVVISLAGDEESMGVLGTQWLIENVPCMRADAVIIGDAGSPRVVRFGEKGFLWIELQADGKAAHGAHVHLGANALERLIDALAVFTSLRSLSIPTPDMIRKAIAGARAVSEPLSGAGESEVLTRITVNIGRIEGGTSTNLVPAVARAGLDIRLPVGVSAAEIEALLVDGLRGRAGVSWRVLRHVEPRFTAPNAEVVRTVVQAAAETLGEPPVANMRVGGSDARLFRAAGMPTVVYGPTPFNMGGADEYASVDELDMVMRVHALSALDFLSR